MGNTVQSSRLKGGAAKGSTRQGSTGWQGWRERLTPRLEPVAGPAYRRIRREWQWRRCGADLRLERASAEGLGYAVAQHQTPLIRPLAGLDPQLQVNKITNLRLAVATLDGRVLQPGQRLSFWWFVGAPSAERGFLPGLVLDHGRMRAGVGGGLCQLTNLIYWMTIHTSLTVVERWRHSHDVFPDAGRTQPFASGATCSWPSLDLQVENRTHTAYRLGLSVTDTHLVGEWRAELPEPCRYEVYERAHVITNELSGVFVRRNLLHRKVFDGTGVEVDDQFVSENHALMMYAPYLSDRPAAPPSPAC
ncbi:MAG TPA: VanW family protein [Dermatophilaceae bacterium]|nr:VanW family protein [Dermatophilaceae bacterium]